MVILLRMLAVPVACQRRGVVSFTRVAGVNRNRSVVVGE
jgi:hypothetical protein